MSARQKPDCLTAGEQAACTRQSDLAEKQKVPHRAKTSLNTAELWCGVRTCKNAQLA